MILNFFVIAYFDCKFGYWRRIRARGGEWILNLDQEYLSNLMSSHDQPNNEYKTILQMRIKFGATIVAQETEWHLIAF